MDPITAMILSQGAGMIQGIGSSLVENAINSPKAQIRRLKKAGIHPNAFYSMGNTGGVGNVDIKAGDPSAQYNNFVTGLKEWDIHQSLMGTGGTPGGQAPARLGEGKEQPSQQNWYVKEAASRVENALSTAAKNRGDDRRAEEQQPGVLRQQRADYESTQKGIRKTQADIEHTEAQIADLKQKTQQDRQHFIYDIWAKSLQIERDQVALMFEKFEREMYMAKNTPLKKIFDYIKDGTTEDLEELTGYINRAGELLGVAAKGIGKTVMTEFGNAAQEAIDKFLTETDPAKVAKILSELELGDFTIWDDVWQWIEKVLNQ